MFRNGCPYSYQALGTLWVHGDCESNTEFGNDAITRTESRSGALWERHMGKRRRRLTLPKQRRVGVAHQPIKVPPLCEKKFLSGQACLTGLPDSPSFAEASLVTGKSKPPIPTERTLDCSAAGWFGSLSMHQIMSPTVHNGYKVELSSAANGRAQD